ncbi:MULTISPECIES: hypothetical protein [unclassified Enterococcus]|uniref:hypothetical protein n=1 Tax=unclassified Enterococcus TaxID=2608891 RepID=UPI00037B9E67|nr:hypothetical protein D931_01870 [Enterococcus faecium 13.SD.W.09]
MKKTSLVAGFVLGVGVLFTLGACSTVEESGEVVSGSGTETLISDSSDEVVVGSEKLSDDGYFEEIVTKGIDPKIKDVVWYETNYENAGWDHIRFLVNHVKIVNVEEFKDKDKDKEYKTLLSLKYQLFNEDSKDKKIKPDKAYLVLNDGKKVEAEVFVDYLDDEILTHDKHKDGFIHFKVAQEQSLPAIKAVEIEFKADGDLTHTYHIDLSSAAEK